MLDFKTLRKPCISDTLPSSADALGSKSTMPIVELLFALVLTTFHSLMTACWAACSTAWMARAWASSEAASWMARA